jgi:hypothetical protein
MANRTTPRKTVHAATGKTRLDPWEALAPRIQHTIAILLLILAPTLLFPSVFWGDQRYTAHDTLQWRATAESIIQEKAQTGEEPLWASQLFAGMPAYLVSYAKAVPNVDTLFVGLTESWYPAAYFWVMMIGMYLFLLSLGFKPLSSVLGALLVGLSTYMPIIVGAGHNTKVVALSFAPWMLLGYSWLRSGDKSKLLSLFVFMGALILELRAGHPQITYYFLWVLGIWFVYDLVVALRARTWKPFLTLTSLALAAGIVALVANAQPYWSIYEYTPYSIRGGSADASAMQTSDGLELTYAFQWSQGLGELLTLAVPGLYGGSEAYWGPKPGTSGPHYFGAITLLFLVIGLWKSTFRYKGVFLTSGVLALLFSLGNHFPLLNETMFHWFPFFNKFRAPETWLVVTALCFPVIAVAGVEYVMDKTRELSTKDWLPAFVPVIILALALGLGSASLFSFEKPGQEEELAQQVAQANQVSPSDPRVGEYVRDLVQNQLIPQRQEKASTDGLRFLIYTFVVVAVVFGVSLKKLSAGPATLILILLAGYDLIQVGKQYSNPNSLSSKTVDAAKSIEQTRRPIDTWLAENVKTEESWSYRVLPLNENAFNNGIPSYFYPSLGGYSGARMAIFDDLMSRVFFVGDLGINLNAFSMLNTKYITYAPGLTLPNLEQVYQDEAGAVYENKKVLPKAWFVESVDLAFTKEMALAKINEFRFDPSRQAVVETTTPIQITPDSTASVKVTQYGARQITLATERTQGAGLLVLSEIYYPKGWTATINDTPSEILKVNYALRGVVVPEGKQTVTFRFEPTSHVWGVPMAFVGHLIWLLVGAGALYQWIVQRYKTPSVAA